ncbi:MAG: hypothetical protein AAFQ65_02465 [Myxococcota bacterium]
MEATVEEIANELSGLGFPEARGFVPALAELHRGGDFDESKLRTLVDQFYRPE